MKTEKKTFIELLKENTESRLILLKKTLIIYWIILIITIITVTLTALIEKENILHYAYGFPLGTIILLILYHILVLYILYQDCNAWSISKKWVIGVFFLGPILLSIYYLKQKTLSIKETTAEKTEETSKEETPPQEVIAEYKDLLQTSSKTKPKQLIWRNTEKIEKEVDTLHIKRAKKPTNEINKKINHLINKKK